MAVPVPSVVQAFAIVRALGDGRAATLSEVAQVCAISPSSCLGLLRTMVGEGVLRQKAGKRYALAPPWAAAMAEDHDAAARLIARARPLLERAARAWQAPVGLWQVAGRDRLRLVALGESAAATRIHMEEGQRQPIGSGAVGRALAAVQRADDQELARRFAGVRWQRPVTEAAFIAQVHDAVVRGHAVDDGWSHAGITSLAAGVPGSPVAFCVSASVFAGSRDTDELTALGTLLSEIAGTLAAADALPLTSSRKARA
jgi:IclR family acetate operon transcriptional repressor